MDSKYHLKLVLNETTGYQRTAGDLRLVDEANRLYQTVIPAIDALMQDGSYQNYVSAIEPYDRFVWEHSHKGDKANIFSYKKIKVSPSWTEQFWAPVFERVRIKLVQHWAQDLQAHAAELVLLQNTQTVTSLTTAGFAEHKDVDVGIGVKVWSPALQTRVVLPMVVCESKTGHFCKTACTGVDGIARRVLDLNPNVLAFTVTDNQISVGREVEVDHAYGSGGILIMHRGQAPKSRESYPSLHAHKFQLVENGCYKYLISKNVSDFVDSINVTRTSGIRLMDKIIQHGYYIPDPLTQYF